MPEAAVSPLTAWADFYVIIGSSAAALTGLMFVVITLIAGIHDRRSDEAIPAFTTPTVVHFSAALAVAAILSAPWQALWAATFPLALSGLGGVAYLVVVVRRVRRQSSYQPVLEDWVWHMILPFVSYIALVGAALALPSNPTAALFITGAMTVLLLFVGIHNAWDAVIYLITERTRLENEKPG